MLRVHTINEILLRQSLDEVEHGSENFQCRGLCHLLKPKAEANITQSEALIVCYYVKTVSYISSECFQRHEVFIADHSVSDCGIAY